MSTSSVYPLGVSDAFQLAKLAGFDGMEIMVNRDPDARDVELLRSLIEQHGLPVYSVHSPVLPGTEFLWGIGGRRKVERSAQLAVALGATTVVVHPPYRWQPIWARRFERAVREISERYGVEIAVENMFGLKLGGRQVVVHSTAHLADLDCSAFTLDISHAAADGRDALELGLELGDRLRHVHLCDGHAAIEGARLADEHLVPGRGGQPVGEIVRMLAERDWDGALIAEVSTRSARDGAERLAMLAETVRFTRSRAAIPRRSPADVPESRRASAGS
jgi:sugar phosphate isomerase/epimerase